MSDKIRRRYAVATALNQKYLDYCSDNLENKLEMVAEIETPTGTIYVSDRNKYVGDTFYEALVTFPVINRTIGEWLAPDLQFSDLQLDISNVDGRFNIYLPGGVSFDSWVGKKVWIKLGVAELASTYKTIFYGIITDIGGFRRSIDKITIVARDRFDTINVNFPKTILKRDDYPKISDGNLGKTLPVIYGTWKEELAPDPAIVPTYCINGNDPMVYPFDRDLIITLGFPAIFTLTNHCLEINDCIQITTSGTLPSGVLEGVDYYVQNPSANNFELSLVPSGASINATGWQTGTHRFKASPDSALRNVKLIISDNTLLELVSDQIYIKKSDIYTLVPTSEIENIGGDNRTFEVKQKSGLTWVDDGTETLKEFVFDQGDEFIVKCVGKDLGADIDNLVAQAKDILKTYGGLTDLDFHSSWATYQAKASPSKSAISTFKSRVWLSEPQGAMSYVLSMLEQVRCEGFINKDLLVAITSLHFEDMPLTPSFTVKNWDVEKATFNATIDDKNNFNRCQAVYNFSPIRDENARATKIYKNVAAITQTGKEISKKVVFPNLYNDTVVVEQLKEILKIASSTIEIMTCNLTWRALLQDIGDFVSINVDIGSAVFQMTPAMIRDIGYDPDGLKLPVKLWSFQMCPYDNYNPGYNGIVGGYNATITEE